MKFQSKDLSKIKLVIWDLDETFWKGTLSDANSLIIPIAQNIQLVKDLTARGIVNAICSKNDKEIAECKLEELDVKRFFVFNSIDWKPKGKRIENLIKKMGLREVNCLFIDDNLSNLGEAEFVLPELMTATPEVVQVLIDNISVIGKDDKLFSRLEQYKVLEKKVFDEDKFSSNEDFLKSSNIRICIEEELVGRQISRIYELIQRSNQLNFTKNRCSLEELNAYIEDSSVRTGCVSVTDNYGEYGLVGFYAIKDNQCIHFLFSCRTMGMGIEQYVYAYLGYPKLDIKEPVSGKLSISDGKPNYITEVTSIEDIGCREENQSFKILIKGPCDLQVMTSYIEASDCIIDTEFNFVDTNGNQADFYNHSINILNSLFLSDDDVLRLCTEFPFISLQAFDTKLFSGKYDIICLSPLMDATLAVFEHRESHMKFPFGLYNQKLSDSKYWDDYIDRKIMTARCHFDIGILKKFSDKFKVYTYSPKEIAQNYSSIFKEIRIKNSKTKFVLFLLHELAYKGALVDNIFVGKEMVHKQINDALKEQFSEVDFVYLLDVNKYISDQTAYFDNINHYSKLVYYHLAQDVLKYMYDIGVKNLKTSSFFKALYDNIKRTIYKIIVLKLIHK